MVIRVEQARVARSVRSIRQLRRARHIAAQVAQITTRTTLSLGPIAPISPAVSPCLTFARRPPARSTTYIGPASERLNTCGPVRGVQSAVGPGSSRLRYRKGIPSPATTYANRCPSGFCRVTFAIELSRQRWASNATAPIPGPSGRRSERSHRTDRCRLSDFFIPHRLAEGRLGRKRRNGAQDECSS